MSKVGQYPAAEALTDADRLLLGGAGSKSVGPAVLAEDVKDRIQNNFLGDTNFKYKVIENPDLDTIVSEFHGYVRNSIHAPSTALTSYGWLDVSVFAMGQGISARQIFNQINNLEVFMRIYQSSTGLFTDWKPLLTPDMVSNPNLLINPDGQIDQRGLGQYSGTKVVTFEPWILGNGSGATVSKAQSGNILLTGQQSLYQNMDGVSVGDTLTYSFKYKTNTNNAKAVITMFKNDNNNYTTLIGDGEWHTFVYTSTVKNNADKTIGISMINTNESVDYIEAKDFKLEYGSFATAFVPPDPATELVKCQRYFYSGRASVCSFSFNTVASETYIPINFQFPVEMRKIPTVKVYSATSNEEGKVNNYLVGGDIANLVVSPNTIRSGSIFALKKTSGTFPSSGIGCVYFEADALT